MGIYYLGQFPPPYGGVTVKNALLFKVLGNRIPIKKLGFRDESSVKILLLLLTSRTDLFLLGFGNERLQRSLVCLLARVRPSVLKRCSLIAMGGMLPNHLSEDERYVNACSKLRQIYVETNSMADKMAELGFCNVSVYPNCRERPPKAQLPKATELPIKCVSCSLISPEKGADVILDAADRLRDVEFHFYGRIQQNYEESFKTIASSLPNVFYHGVFDSVRNDVIAELAQYDLHLFPTRWPNEGVPGVLVETKMAAIPSIVSNICYNAELVKDGSEGIVLSEYGVESLTMAIGNLRDDLDTLDKLKAGALASSERFYADQYINLILSGLYEAPRNGGQK